MPGATSVRPALGSSSPSPRGSAPPAHTTPCTPGSQMCQVLHACTQPDTRARVHPLLGCGRCTRVCSRCAPHPPSVAAPGPLGGAAPTLRPLQPSPWQRSGFINGDKFREGSRRGGRRRRSCAGTWRAAVGAHGDAAHACARGARPGCGWGARGGEHPSPKEAAPCLAAGSFSSSCREGRARAGRWVLCLAGGVERGCARGRPGLLSPVWGGGSAACPVLSTQDSESGRWALFLACH